MFDSSESPRYGREVESVVPIQFPIFFPTPARLTLSAWDEHIPFAMFLVRVLKPAVIVELGIEGGDSYCAFCQTVQALNFSTRCFGVDTWKGDSHTGFYGPEVLENLRAYHDPLYGSFSRLIQGTFDQALPYFGDGTITLLHIDGCHTYEAVKHDFESWLPKLSRRAVVLFHDTNVREREFGVWRYWNEVKRQYPHFEFVHGHGLGVLGVGPDQPKYLRDLYDASDEVTAATREYFFQLGHKLVAQSLDKAEKESLHRQAEKDKELLTSTSDLQHSLASQVAEKDQQIQRLSSELKNNSRTVAILAEKERALRDLQALFEERDRSLHHLESVLAQIQNSHGWRALQPYYRLRNKLFPATEKRDKTKSPHQAQHRIAPIEERQRTGGVGPAILRHGGLRRGINLLRSSSLIEGVRLLRDMRLISGSGLFHSAWYLIQNPDVASAGVNPVRHYLRRGATEGRDPNPHFDSDWYLQNNPDVLKAGVNPLVHYLRRGAVEGRNPNPYFDGSKYLAENPDVARAGINPLVHYLQSGTSEKRGTIVSSDHNGPPAAVEDILRIRFSALRPLKAYSVPNLGPRVTMVTDSINQGSLFGGVATGIIFATLLAKRIGGVLRIITRRERADEANFHKIIDPSGVQWQGDVQFVYADVSDESNEVDVGKDDLFITTSWWTTWSVKQYIAEQRIIYLLQEDERMFYPFGDDLLRCTETLRSAGMQFVVNSRVLYEHFVSQGFDKIQQNGLWFEPSFPEEHFHPDSQREGHKKNFLFYARPTNLRNLYYRGLETINQALQTGVLDPQHWNFFFVGKDLTELSFARGARPKIIQHLEWAEYAALLRRIDVGLCLMYTPHPSYPPLDLAACGAVTVTNRFGLKQSLESYSRNILCRELDVDSLVDGIAEAVNLSADDHRRTGNFRDSFLLRDWMVSFEGVLKNLEGRTRVHSEGRTDKILRPLDKAARG